MSKFWNAISRRWKIILAIIFVVVFFIVSNRMSKTRYIRYVPVHGEPQNDKVLDLDGTHFAVVSKINESQSSSTENDDRQIMGAVGKLIEKIQTGLFDSVLNMKARINRPPSRIVHITNHSVTTAPIPSMPGLISMDRDLTLPPEVPFRPDSKEPLLHYSQRRDYDALLSHDDKCGVGRHAAIDLSLTNFNYETDIFLLMVIKSRCDIRQGRDAVRNTWADENAIKKSVGVNIKRLFLLGECSTDRLQREMIAENQKHDDLLAWNFFDSFRNLTLKECLFLQWYSKWCQNVPYIFKGDDDVFVNTRNIVQYLKDLPLNKRRDLFLGAMFKGTPRISKPHSKYYVSYNLYPEKMYPPYLSGVGFVMSNNMATRLFQATLTTRIIPIDDAFLGILSKKIGVEPENDKTFKSWGIKKRNACRLAKIKTYHKVSPQEILKFWKEYTQLDVSTCNSSTDDVFLNQRV